MPSKCLIIFKVNHMKQLITDLGVKSARIEFIHVLAARNTKNTTIPLRKMTVSYQFLSLFNFVNSRVGFHEEALPVATKEKGKVSNIIGVCIHQDIVKENFSIESATITASICKHTCRELPTE